MNEQKLPWPSHDQMVARLAKSGAEILATLTPEKVDLWHAATGIVTEAGELMDMVKKYVVYNKPLDLINGVEEMGDIEFYLEQARQNLRIARMVVVNLNMQKLAKRYPTGYSDAAAQARADKNEKN